MPKLLDFKSFCENLKEVTTSKIMEKKKFHPEGLFSEQIFGPLKNYTCQCGTYYGISRSGGTCDLCGVDIANSDERRRRFAKIILPIPVVNPVFYDLIIDLGGNYLKRALDDLMKNEKSILYKPNEDEYAVTTNQTFPPMTKTWDKLDAIRELVSGVARNLKGVREWEVVEKNLDQLLIRTIIVLPPDLRPAAKGVERNSQIVDKINRYYMQILTKKEIMKETLVDILGDKSLFYQYFKQLQKDVNELYEHILLKLSKKEGLIRGNILGKRIDFSGRAVIVPDPTINLDECVLPYLMFLELFKLPISRKLIEIGRFKLLNDAIDFVDKCIELKNTILFKICEELAENEVCLLNRQPSLHRLSMLGFKIKVSLDNVIKIHPLSCPGFNADFDGDQMAVYIPITEESKEEVLNKFLITRNLSNPANESLTTVPNQDIILGVYTLTSHQFPYLQEKVEFKGQTITEDTKIFNECLPEGYQLVDRSVDKRELVKILNDIKLTYPEDVVAKTLDNIKMVGFKYSTLFGSTMSLDSCEIVDLSGIRDSLYDSDNIRTQLAKVSSRETRNFLVDNFKYSYMIKSGARGSWDQVRQVILTRGFISNFKGEILPTPIKHSLLDGLDQQEFFNSTYGCRKGLLDVALNTGSSGYLSRKLIFACANLQISSTRDCGSKDFLDVFVRDEKKARMLMNRYFLDNGKLTKITEENYNNLVGKTIKIRSPILCLNDKICRVCYGDLYKTLKSRFVGVIAAQSLGECNTQLILRVFHTSGVARIRGLQDDGMRQMDVIGDLSRVSRMLHQFNKDTNYTDLVYDLFEAYNRDRDIHHIHFECVVAQLMWKGFKKWRLLPERDKIEPEYVSIQSSPSRESWLLGLAFSNPKRHILKGILYSGSYSGIMDKLLCGEKLELK